MRKNLIVSLVASGLFAASSVASAVQITDLKTDGGSQIYTGITGTYNETGATSATLTDMTHQTSTAVLLFEFAGWKNDNSFGLYNLDSPENKLQIFAGSDSPTTYTRVSFDKNTGYATTGSFDVNGSCDVTQLNCGRVGTTFGFYLDNTQQSLTWYSDPTLNTSDGGADHMYAFDTSHAVKSDFNAFQGSDLILAWDDQPANGQPAADRDFNDMIVGMDDVAVTEPGTMALFGLALVGLGFAAGRKKKS